MSVLALFITAIIWGTAFVAQKTGMDYLGPFSFNAIRYGIGSVVLIPVIYIFRAGRKRQAIKVSNMTEVSDLAWESGTDLRNTVIGGILVGLALCAASLFQQFGIMHTTVGKAGFVTALYIVIVPFYGVLLKRKIAGKAWIAAFIALIGFYLMCMTGRVTLSLGDGLVLIGSFIWGVQIMLVDKYAPKADAVMLSSIEFGVSSFICAVLALIFERKTTTWDAVCDCAGPILYAGVMSCGVAYTLQVVAQKKVKPTLACLIMSLEAVFSALAGWVILGQSMTAIELAGCALVFFAVVIAQI
ncbi:MAG: DMT family transporter [Lachnospiraceae bacterium]|nr:DMT family transporter [Lachnospiraceae bacterium]